MLKDFDAVKTAITKGFLAGVSLMLLIAAPAAVPAAEAPSVSAKPEPQAAPPAASADQSSDEDPKAAGAGLPIPRFVSLRTNPINLRTGPGVRYPVDWVYVRRQLPVEVIGEFDTWRRIRDQDGAEGWVHQSMLSGKRTGVVVGSAQGLKRAGEDSAEVVTTLDAGVIVTLLRCPTDSGYCRVEVENIQGWLKRDQLWGVYPGEVVQ
jgi:SH3-like domain-containing protein